MNVGVVFAKLIGKMTNTEKENLLSLIRKNDILQVKSFLIQALTKYSYQD